MEVKASQDEAREDEALIPANRRQQGSDVKVSQKIPEVADTYNKSMGFVDQFDADRARYISTHRNMTWRRTAFFTMLKFSLVNAWHMLLIKDGEKDKGRANQAEALEVIREHLVAGTREEIRLHQEEKKKKRKADQLKYWHQKQETKKKRKMSNPTSGINDKELSNEGVPKSLQKTLFFQQKK